MFTLPKAFWSEGSHAPKIQVEVLMPSMMGLGDGAFGRCLDRAGGAPVHGIRVLNERVPREIPYPPCQMWLQPKDRHL